MKVLIAHRHSAVRTQLAQLLQANAELDLVLAEDARQLAACAGQDPSPDALVLEAALLGACLPDVRRRASVNRRALSPYVLSMAETAAPAELEQCLRSGADAALPGPLAPDLLLAHLNALSALLRRRASGVRQVLADALQSAAQEGSGELVIRGREKTARVYLYEGKIAWIHVPGESISLADLLPPDSGLDDATATMLVDECRTQRTALSDTLVRWGLVDRDRLAESLRRWLSQRWASISEFADPLTLFVPQAFTYSDEMLFAPLELLGPEPWAPAPDPGPARPARREWSGAFFQGAPGPAVSRLLADCSRLQGACGAAILDAETGSCLDSSGTDLDPEIAWAFLRLLETATRDRYPADLAISIGERYHLLRTLSGSAHLAAYVVLRADQTRLATAQIELRLLLDRQRQDDGASGCDGRAAPRHSPGCEQPIQR